MNISKFHGRIASAIVIFMSVASLSCHADSIKLTEAKKTVLDISVDSVPTKVTWYTSSYVTAPNRPQDQKINIYIPEGATKASPIIFIVNNAGWRSNNYPENTIQNSRDYDGTNDKIGVALKEKYVVVSYGGRSRADGLTDGKYLGHSPAIMVDTKAAIRYLRYNQNDLPAGDTDKIIVTGTSGGGALSTVIATSGNSEDYFPYLYEIGAAGIVKNADGSYSSEPGCGDNVFACISYCPITDLGHGDAAYEWLYRDIRKALYQYGKMNYSDADEATVMAASEELSEVYAKYVDSLGLKDENGNDLNSSNLSAFITRLMESEISKSIEKYGIESMKSEIEKQIASRGGFGGPGRGGQRMGQGGPGMVRPDGNRPAMNQNGPQNNSNASSQAAKRENNGWLSFNEDGTFKYDLTKHLYYVALYTTLKIAPSFSNYGLYHGGMNEDNLFGTVNDEYCPFNPYSWNNDNIKNNVGKDDTGLTWDEFVKTETGKALLLETKMTSAMDYLIEGKADSAPYMYVRHGMDDRDASWAVEATLFASIMNSPKVKGHNVGFAWLKPHSGDYDVPEAYAWLKSILSK